MTQASRLSFVLAVLALTGCAIDDRGPLDSGPTGPVVSDEDGTDDATPFVARGGGHVATSAVHEAIVTDGVIRMRDPRSADGPIDFATDAVTRDAAITASVRGTALQADGAVAIDRGALTELVENRGNGVEQSWLFAQPPRGAADLVVRVRVSGHDAVSRDGHGLHVRAGVDGGFHYSDATWIDADGIRTAIPVAWANDRIQIRVPAHLVDTSAYPVVLDPVIGGEGAVEPLVDGFSGGRARQPSIAPSTNRYLAVWRDDRSGYTSDIFAARINTDGTLVDAAGLQITTTPADEGAPRVVWLSDLNRWLIVWSVNSDTIGAATLAPNATLTQLGTVTGVTGAASHDLAGDGGVALLVYQSTTADAGDVYAVRYDGAGFGAPVAIAAAAGVPEANPTVTGSDGGDFLVAYQTAASANIRGELVTQAGTLAGNFSISTDLGVQSTPSAAFDGTNYVVTWKHAPSEIWGARVSPTGTVLDTTGSVGGVVLASATTLLTNPEVSCDAANCLFAWEDRRDTVNLNTGVFGQRRNDDFTPVGGVITINDATRSQNNLVMAPRATGGQFILFDDRAVGIHNISLVRANSTGNVLDPTPILVSRGTKNSHRQGGFARSATGQLAVWQDSRRFGDDIMALRYSATGAKIDGTFGARVVSDAANTQNAPSIDHDGTQYLVAWADTRNATFDVFAARFLDDGTNLDPGGIPLSTITRNQTAPDVASGGGVSLVVWADESVPASRSDIVGAIVTPSGTFTRFDICRTSDEQDSPEVAWDPSSAVYVVTWQDLRSGTDYDLFATRVQPDGTVLDGCGVQVAGGAGDQRAPDISTAGAQVLVVWEDHGSDVAGDILAARVTTAGGLTVVDATPLAIATGAAAQLGPSAGGLSNGRWSLAWEDWSNTATQGSDVVGNELSSTGTLLGAQYAIAATTEWEHGARFQSGVNTTRFTYLMYQKTKDGTQVIRVFRRKITHLP